MHTTSLRAEDFAVTIRGAGATLQDVFPDFSEHDRLGIVLASDFAATGAANLVLAAVTAFYDRLRATGEDFFAYADYYAFHVGRPRGSLLQLDVYPQHKEVEVPAEPEQVLRAIVDRGITRLLVSGAPGGPPELDRITVASARRLIRTAVAYSPAGRVHDADVMVRGSERSEAFVTALLASTNGAPQDGDPAAGAPDRAPASAHAVRGGLRVDGGTPTESFRRIALDEALRMLPARADAE